MATVARSPHRNNSWEIMMNPEDIGISITIFIVALIVIYKTN
jgi:hypothetical protein